MWYLNRITDIVLPWVCTISLVVIAWSLSACSTYKTQSDYGTNWKTRKDLKAERVPSEPFDWGGYVCIKNGDDINCKRKL